MSWTKYVWKHKVFPKWMVRLLYIPKSPPPKGVIIAKGSTHIAANRGFVRYAVWNATARALLDWLKDAHVPDEHFFNSLNSSPNLKVPGAYTGMYLWWSLVKAT